MFSESNYKNLIREFNKKLEESHGKEFGTYVEDERFTVHIDKERIIATTLSSGNPQRIRRTNAEAALHVLVSKRETKMFQEREAWMESRRHTVGVWPPLNFNSYL